MENLIHFIEKEIFVKEQVARIANMPLKEGSHLYQKKEDLNILIKDAVKKELKADNVKMPSALILLNVVLAANRDYNKHVKPNIKKIQENYPTLKTFEDLRLLIASTTKEEFFRIWGHKNEKKYDVLNQILQAALQLKEKYKEAQNDLELMNIWAKKIDLEEREMDLIGSIKHVGLATVQHLRMDFGLNTVKPDQRVIEVLEREFHGDAKHISQEIAIKQVEEISKITNISVREIDMIFVNYGSGYYNNRQYNAEQKVRIEIAEKLIKMGLSVEIISEVTGVSSEKIDKMKKS